MTKTLLSVLAISTALSVNAAGPASGQPAPHPFKTVAKTSGNPSMSGLGSVGHIQQAVNAIKFNGISYKKSNYDPAAIKEVKYAPGQKNPIFVTSDRIINIPAGAGRDEVASSAIQFLEQNKALLMLADPAHELSVKDIDRDAIGFTHIKFSQTYNGYPLMGKEVIVHFTPHGTIVNGRWAATPSVGAPAGLIGAQTAVWQAANVVTEGKGLKTMNQYTRDLLKYNGPTAELVVYTKDRHNDKDRWAYKVTLRTDFINMYEVMVDAQTGAVLYSNNISCTTGPAVTHLNDLNGVNQTVNVYQHSNGTYYMIDVTRSMFSSAQSQMPDNPVGAIWTLDAQGAASSNIQVAHVSTSNINSWPSSQNATSAYANGAAAYTYYQSTHSRNSIDGNGGTIISVINVNDDQGQPMDNAFWNGQLMAYGNGDQAFKPLAGGLDVAGHEMTHGVIQSTANLAYQDQSGALNESMADVFGAMIDRSNWTIGEQVCLPGFFPSNALRDLSNPHNGASQGGNGWQPATMSEFVNTTSDHGGVHTNSGITNHAFYYFATAVTKQKAELVYYRALKNYLTQNSEFLDARLAVVQAAQDLYGSTEVQAAKTAFDNVEIYDGTNTNPTNNNPVTGTDWIMMQNSPGGSNALYMVKPQNPQASDFHPLNTTFALNNVSITDDGSYAFFVGTDHNLYSITADYSNPVQTQMTNNGDWDNVAVSRDGNRLALVSQYQDTAIYIYDGVSQQFVKYHLYNPTYSQGVVTNGPLYADALDWDPTGEYVIYDEFNQFNNTSSTTNISYWDVGVLDAWDISAGTFANGQISKLVNDLPDGISIGNPVFSKNHSDVVAFDVSDGTTFDIQAANLTTGDIGTVVTGNSVANIPSYSTNDDAITFTSVDNSSVSLVGIEPLASDFINGGGSITWLANNAEYSVWFTKGTRANAQCAGLSANITAQGPTDYPLSSVVLDAGSGYTSYAWNTGATSRTITVTTAGTYVVTVTTGTGCTLTTAPLTIGYPTGVISPDQHAIKVYPVPSSDRVIVEMDGAEYAAVDITDLTGRLVATQPVSGTRQSVNISTLESGIYMLTLKDANNSTRYTTRIIKQ
ncbi:MAG: M4 family metallopeptidase [Bacteroidetes bacterium]|nr:M4 family metallopeptidase [Bacteroidota bacterium]